MTEIRQKIYAELQNSDFPNLGFFYSSEVLDIAPEILDELLEKEKQDFQKKLKTKDEEITFETFEDFSLLDYFFSILSHYQGVYNDAIIRKIIEGFEPKYIDFGNELVYNKRLYEMYVYCSEHCELDTQQRRIIDKTLKAYDVRGISLPEEKQNRLKEISKNLSELSQKFSNNVLDDRAEFEYVIEDEDIISEMPEDDRNIAREKYEKKNAASSPLDKGRTQRGGYIFDASTSSYIAIMKYCSDSSVRKHFYDARISFASRGKYDNREIVLEILKLRDEKAQILGYHNFAQLKLEFKMAESPQQVKKLFGEIASKAQVKAKAELDEIVQHFGLTDMQPWDSSYYSRKLREEKYALDDAELKKYFVFENVRDAMFETVKRLYNIEMKEINPPVAYDIPLDRGEQNSSSLSGRMPAKQEEGGESYLQNIHVYEVYKDGEFLSYFFTDYFYNPLKRQGAWADLLREKYNPPVENDIPLDKGEQNSLPLSRGDAAKQQRGFCKIVLNVCNFQKNTSGTTLLTLGEVETMYHEFGHAIHEMLSFSPHSELSGFHVEHDFVELPSQLLENWARDEEGMKLFARHFETNSEIPREMLEKLKKLETFGNGNFVLKQNEYAMLDMKLHSETIPKNIFELQDISDEVYMQNTLFPISEKYMTYASFSHIFDGGYAAGYYSYMWAEIIEKEVWKILKDSGNIFDSEIADKLYKTILGAGTTKKASELFRDFAGRDPDIDAFLQEKGLV